MRHMKTLLFALALISAACYIALQASAPAQARVAGTDIPDAPIISAIAINASKCRLPPAIVIVRKDGSLQTIEKKDVTPALLAQLAKLPQEHMATLVIPCGTIADKSGVVEMKHHYDKCGEDWAERNQFLFQWLHCARI